MNVLHPSLLKSFALSICRGYPMKTQSWNIFATVRAAKYIASCSHDGSLEANYCVPFLKLKLESDWKVPFREIHFCGLKEDF